MTNDRKNIPRRLSAVGLPRRYHAPVDRQDELPQILGSAIGLLWTSADAVGWPAAAIFGKPPAKQLRGAVRDSHTDIASVLCLSEIWPGIVAAVTVTLVTGRGERKVASYPWVFWIKSIEVPKWSRNSCVASPSSPI